MPFYDDVYLQDNSKVENDFFHWDEPFEKDDIIVCEAIHLEEENTLNKFEYSAIDVEFLLTKGLFKIVNTS